MNCFDCKSKKILFSLVIILLGLVIFSLAYLINFNFSKNKEQGIDQRLNSVNIFTQDIDFESLNLKDNEAIIIINDKKFKLEIVKDPMDMYRGLSNRPELCPSCGMLFVFSDLGQRSFVMRDMNFPLDIIFLAEGKIVKIYDNLAPEGSNPRNFYNSEKPADRVLEINAGLASKLGLKEGDNLILPK